MYKTIITTAFVCCFLLAHSQDKEIIDKIIRDSEQKAVKGILLADTNILKQVWAPGFIVNTPRNNIAENREAVFKNQKAGLINYSTFERVIENLEVMGNVAITMGYETYVPRTDLPEAKAGQVVKRRFTNVWMNQNGWVQVARHASVICP